MVEGEGSRLQLALLARAVLSGDTAHGYFLCLFSNKQSESRCLVFCLGIEAALSFRVMLTRCDNSNNYLGAIARP